MVAIFHHCKEGKRANLVLVSIGQNKWKKATEELLWSKQTFNCMDELHGPLL